MKKWLKSIALFLAASAAAVALAVAGINLYIKSYASSYILTEVDAGSLNADCILVLGASVYPDKTPSSMLEDRLLKGIELYRDGTGKKLLMSGDHGQDYYDEVDVMKKFAVEREVPSGDVFMDHAGFSTYESMYRAKSVFQAQKIVIVTQGYHLYRAVYIAREMGLDAYGVPSDQRTYGGQARRDVREVLARTKDFIFCIAKPEPTYLGDAIPVSGNGDDTNDGKEEGVG